MRRRSSGRQNSGAEETIWQPWLLLPCSAYTRRQYGATCKPTFHRSVSPGRCSSSTPASCWCAQESSKHWFKHWGPDTPAGDPDGVPGSQLLSDLDLQLSGNGNMYVCVPLCLTARLSSPDIYLPFCTAHHLVPCQQAPGHSP